MSACYERATCVEYFRVRKAQMQQTYIHGKYPIYTHTRTDCTMHVWIAATGPKWLHYWDLELFNWFSRRYGINFISRMTQKVVSLNSHRQIWGGYWNFCYRSLSNARWNPLLIIHKEILLITYFLGKLILFLKMLILKLKTVRIWKIKKDNAIPHQFWL